MKKLLLLFIIFSFSKVKTQIVFCPPGAEWHYTFRENAPGPINTINRSVNYVRDSLLNGETVKILRHDKILARANMSSFSFTFIKQKGDTVFIKSTFTNNQWCILFNFAALPGQSWQIPLSIQNNLSYTVTVDSVNSILLNGYNLKRLFVNYRQSNSANATQNYTTSIIERIGGSGSFYLFNFYGNMSSDGDELQDFLCYSDNTFGLKQFTSLPCNFENSVGLTEYKNLKPFQTFPNPTSGVLHLNFEDQNLNSELKINIINMMGETVVSYQTEKIKKSEFELDLKNLTNGIYFIKVVQNGNVIATEKLIKE